MTSEDTSEESRIEAILHAPYLEKVVREALRLYTPVPVTRREAECDAVIPVGGDGILLCDGQRTNQVVIPKGSLLSIHSWALHRDPEIWGDDADQFDPDRKQPTQSGSVQHGEDSSKGKNHLGDSLTYMPFLVGSRSCVGQRFAMAQVSMLLTNQYCRYKRLTMLPFVCTVQAATLPSDQPFRLCANSRG